MEVSYAVHPEGLDVPDATFACPDLTTFWRLDDLGPGEVVGQRLEPGRRLRGAGSRGATYAGCCLLFLGGHRMFPFGGQG